MKWKILIVLMVGVAVYTVVGAMVFTAIEHPHEMEMSRIAANKTMELKARYSHLPPGDVDQLIHEVLRASANGELIKNDSRPVWTFAGSLFFVGTVITTVGYGNMAPVTVWGRGFCIIYALVGIPLNFAFLAGIGSKMNAFTKRFDGYLCWQGHRPQVVRVFRAFLTFLAGWVVFLLLPSVFLSWHEGWAYRDAIYFSFITIATIGFGDIVPAFDNVSKIDWSRFFVVTWVWLGLAWLSTVIANIAEVISNEGAPPRNDRPEEEPCAKEKSSKSCATKCGVKKTVLVSHGAQSSGEVNNCSISSMSCSC